MERRNVGFESEDATLRGWFYVPDARPPWPLIVMVHGYSATRTMVADRYAECFCGHGLAALLYDHRGFGASGGEPRRQTNPWIQARGYRDAFSHAGTLEGVDRDRIALWGDSLSGDVVLAVAAVEARVAALVVQVPVFGDDPLPEDADGSRFGVFKETLLHGNVEPAGDAEVAVPMPVVSDDPARRSSALRPLTAYRWFIEYGGRFGSGWVNDISGARPKTPVPWRPSPCASHVRCPTLFVVSSEDEMEGASPAAAREAWNRLSGDKEWLEVGGGHFGLLYYPSAEFDRASRAEADFLSGHLRDKRS